MATKIENSNPRIESELRLNLGQQVRLRVNNGVAFTYCGNLYLSGEGFMVARKDGPEVYFTLSSIRALHGGPTQDMLAIHIS